MIKIAAIIFLSIFLLFFPIFTWAKSGCCSGHNGVNCAAGPQGNGNVICNDGWTGSSCLYSEMIMCGGSSTNQAPVYVTPTNTPYVPLPTSTPYIPPPINTPFPTNTPRPEPTNTPTPTNIPTLIPPSPTPTSKSQVLGETTTSQLTPLNKTISIGILSGLGYGGYRLVKKFKDRK